MSKTIIANTTAQRQAVPLAAVYARVSTTDQADRGYSLPTQIEACQALAQREGYTVPDSHIFVDDSTGISLNRPQFTKLRDLIHQRLVHAVIAYDLDRLSRKLAHQLLLSDEFEQAGVTLHIVTMPASDKTPETQLLANVRGIIAEYERAKILERTARGLRGRVQAGFVPSGNVPLGYTYEPCATGGGHYILNQEEAHLVQRIFHMCVQSGLSTHAIAERLTRERVPTQRDRRARGPSRTLAVGTWQPSSVYLILKNATYTGTMHYGKTANTYGTTNPDKKTTHRRKPQEEWLAVPVPRIIDQDTFDAAQVRMQQNARTSRRNRKHEYLLCNARLRCEQCGTAMTGQSRHGGKYRYYRCGRSPFQQTRPCRRTVSAQALEPEVWRAIETALQHPELIAREVQRRAEHADTEQNRLAREQGGFTRQLAQCDKEMQKWEAAYVGDVITLDDFKAKKAEIGVRRASVEQALTQLTEEQRVLEHAVLEMASLITYCERVRANLRDFSLKEKCLAMEALNISVIWHPHKPLEIRGSIPVSIVHSTPGCAASLARHRPTAQSRAGLWHG
jgi:site-specific DNA recombinase